jgi:AraC family transcriptional regulator
MFNPPDILSLVQQQPLMQGDLQMLQHRHQQIPGSVQYSIYRYRRQPQWSMEDTGMLVYHYNSAAVRRIQNVICASSVLPKPVWKGWTVWMP